MEEASEGRLPDSWPGLVGRISPPVVSWPYRIALALVSLAVVLLPLVYLAVIGAVGYGVVWHAREDAWVLREGRASSAVIVYFGPIVAGGIALLFLVKPLFARRARRPEEHQLGPEDQPRLFSFVERLSDVVGAPFPRSIGVDVRVNASASLRRGLRSIFGRDLRLTIGLPLAAGFTLRQFAGVLAHELGHFRQGAGMRLSYLVWSVNAWFARVVHERDEWDESLVRWSKRIDFRLAAVLLAARGMVWLSRRILWVLMTVASLLSAWLLRQMEYDADRFQAEVAGSGRIRETFERLHLLSAAEGAAWHEVADAWEDRWLPDDFPALVLAEAERAPAEVREGIRTGIDGGKAGFLSSHPATRARIAAIERRVVPGRIDAEGPASDLLAGFPDLCRAASSREYRARLGPRFKPEMLRPASRLAVRRDEERAAAEAVARYGREPLSRYRPLRPPAVPLPAVEDAEAATRRILDARGRMLAAETGYAAARARHEDVVGNRLILAALDSAIRAKVRAESPKLGLKRASREDLVRLSAREAEAEREAVSGLQPFESALSERLFTALAMVPGEDRDEVGRLLSAADGLAPSMSALPGLSEKMGALGYLAGMYEERASSKPYAAEVGRLARGLERDLLGLREELDGIPYPFEHGRGSISVGRFALPALPARPDPGAVLAAAEGAIEALSGLYFRLWGRLFLLAEEVEARARAGS